MKFIGYFGVGDVLLLVAYLVHTQVAFKCTYDKTEIRVEIDPSGWSRAYTFAARHELGSFANSHVDMGRSATERDVR